MKFSKLEKTNYPFGDNNLIFPKKKKLILGKKTPIQNRQATCTHAFSPIWKIQYISLTYPFLLTYNMYIFLYSILFLSMCDPSSLEEITALVCHLPCYGRRWKEPNRIDGNVDSRHSARHTNPNTLCLAISGRYMWRHRLWLPSVGVEDTVSEHEILLTECFTTMDNTIYRFACLFGRWVFVCVTLGIYRKVY